MLKVIVFPGSRIISILSKLSVSQKENVLIILSDGYDQKLYEEYQLKIISNDEFNPKNYLIDSMHPCSEAALYYISSIEDYENLPLRFSTKSFECFFKISLGEHLIKADIPMIKKHVISDRNMPKEFPLIVKPNFGFGSYFVSQVKNEKELESYLEQIKNDYTGSIVGEFFKKYFKNNEIEEANICLYEACKSYLTFFSSPFLVKEKKVVAVYPTKAEGALIFNKNQKRHVEFVYPPDKDEYQHEIMLQICQKLIDYFDLEDGVYHSEFLSNNTETYLVEFSPRITGGVIAFLSSKIHGVDLFAKSIAPLFENIDCYIVEEKGRLKLIRTYIDNDQSNLDIPKPEDCLYYEKRHQKESLAIEYIIKD